MLDEKSFESENIPLANLQVIDPLGEIRRCAKELWLKDGSPRDGDFHDYWQRAEKILLGPFEFNVQRAEAPLSATDPKASPPKNSSAAVSHPLAQLVAKVFPNGLLPHDALCLAHLLTSYSFHFSPTPAGSSVSLGPLELPEIVEVLVMLGAPLQERETPVSPFVAATSEEWGNYLKEEFASDQPLSNHDRTSIRRILNQLRSLPEVATISSHGSSVLEVKEHGEIVEKKF